MQLVTGMQCIQAQVLSRFRFSVLTRLVTFCKLVQAIQSQGTLMQLCKVSCLLSLSLRNSQTTNAKGQDLAQSCFLPVQELKGLNSHLESTGPYLKGKDVSSGDLALAPKLHHMQVALKAFRV